MTSWLLFELNKEHKDCAWNVVKMGQESQVSWKGSSACSGGIPVQTEPVKDDSSEDSSDDDDEVFCLY